MEFYFCLLFYFIILLLVLSHLLALCGIGMEAMCHRSPGFWDEARVWLRFSPVTLRHAFFGSFSLDVAH